MDEMINTMEENGAKIVASNLIKFQNNGQSSIELIYKDGSKAGISYGPSELADFSIACTILQNEVVLYNEHTQEFITMKNR